METAVCPITRMRWLHRAGCKLVNWYVVGQVAGKRESPCLFLSGTYANIAGYHSGSDAVGFVIVWCAIHIRWGSFTPSVNGELRGRERKKTLSPLCSFTSWILRENLPSYSRQELYRVAYSFFFFRRVGLFLFHSRIEKRVISKIYFPEAKEKKKEKSFESRTFNNLPKGTRQVRGHGQ